MVDGLNWSWIALMCVGPLPLAAALAIVYLAALVDEATSALDQYEYTRALDRSEAFFWSFCDNYLELVKARRYGDHGEEGARSANRAKCS